MTTRIDTHSRARTLDVEVDTDSGAAGPVELTIQDHDRTRTFLLLHGGGGVRTMAAFADLLADRTGGRVLLPTHPGFGGTPKAEGLTDVAALARTYVALLDRLQLTDVTVIGNSFGGWLAAEIALLRSPRVADLVLLDAIGIEVAGHPLRDVRGMSPTELQTYSFHDPAKAPAPPAGADRPGPGPDVTALIGYTGPTMSDPTLADRLAAVDLPVRVLWGESDRIVDPGYGRALAATIPSATFTLLPHTGHLPQLETPLELVEALIAGA